MKFNWGHGLTLGMVLFVGYIMFMVIQAMNTDHDLETEDYYAKELLFQETIDKNKNYLELNSEIKVESSNGHMLVEFPHSDIDSGSITLYRPSDKKLDSRYILKLSEPNKQYINVAKKPTGRYIIEADWSVNGVGYFVKKNIVL